MDTLKTIIALIEAITKLADSLKGMGIDLSGIKLHTTDPLDLSKILHGLGGQQ